MRAFQRLLANAADASTTASLMSSRPVALLPPIPLYRRILRSHRKLPGEHRVLGDAYVKAEFHAHQKIDNPIHIIGFLSEWQMYVQQLEGESWRDGKLDKMKLDKMSDEQLAQLYELMQEIKKVGEQEAIAETEGAADPQGSKQ